MVLDFVSSNFTLIAVAVLIITAIWFFVKYDVIRIGRVSRGLDQLTGIVRDVNGYGADSAENTCEVVVNSDMPVFIKEAWIDYYIGFKNWRGLYAQRNTDGTGSTGSADSAGSAGSGRRPDPGPDLYPDISDRFTEYAVAHIPASRHKAEMMSVFIGNLGVALFFLRLLAGSYGFDFNAVMTAIRTAAHSEGAVTAASPSLYAAISDIIARIITAFPGAVIVLLAALALSALLQYVDRHFYDRVLSKLHMFHEVFRMKVPAADNSWLMGSMLAEQRRQTETLYRTAPEIVSSLDGFIGKSFIPSMLKSYEDAIKKHLEPVLKGMGATLEKMAAVASQSQLEGMKALSESFLNHLNAFAGEQFSHISDSISDVSALQLKTKDALQAFSSSFESTLGVQKQMNVAMETVSGSIANYQKDISQMNAQLTGTLEMTAGLVEKLKVMLEQVQSGMKEADSARQETKAQVDTYFSKMDEQVMKLTDDMHSVVENIFSRFNDMAGTTFERIETDLGKLAEGFEDNSIRVLESMETQSQSIGLYAKQIVDEVSELNSNLERSVKGFDEGIRSDVLSVFNEFDKGMTEISGRFAVFAQGINDSLDEILTLAGNIKNPKRA